jgi:glycosyltransferase involved in cell wall biosynthesis
MPAKVFLVINSMAQGGAERQMAELVRRLPRDRFEPVLCSLGPANAYGHLLPEGQPRYVLEGGMDLAGAKRLRGWLVDERPDIVHSFMEQSNFWNRLLAPGIGDPVVITSVRGPLMKVRYRLVEALLATRCHAITVNSVAIRDELVRWQRVPPSKIRIVPNIVDFERFKPAGDATRRRARESLGVTGTTFLIPGRVHMVKDPLAPPLAAALLRRAGKLPSDATFLMAGRLDHGPVLKAIAAIDRAGRLGGAFRYLGPRSDMTDLYAASDWVLLASYSEGLCNAALEAHACGRPLILSRAANPDGILEDGVTGYEFGTARFWSLAGALERALATPPQRAADMGRAGLERVRRMFDPEAALRAMVDLYEELLGGVGRPRPTTRR